MTFTEALLTHPWYGYPYNGAPRRHKPHIIAVVHQTATTPYEGQAMAMRNARNGSTQPNNTATYYVDHDSGNAVHAVDGTKYASWCAGGLAAPDTKNPSIATVVQHHNAGYNPNECAWEQIECCGKGTEPWSDAQFETAAKIIAARAKLCGLPINRQTVVPHRDLNTVNRPSDPWPAATREARMAKLITMANAVLNPSTPVPTEDPVYPITQYLPGYTVVIGDPNDETWIAKTPSPTAALYRKFAKGATETWTVIGYIKGEYSAFGNSDEWLVRWNVDHYEYTAKGNVRSVSDPLTAQKAADAADKDAAVLAAKQGQYDLDAKSVAAKLTNARPV